MIKSLQIRNYAIIESLEINFSKGLTIITGETGAGKSILLGALGLIMGNRADTKSLYDESEKCVIEGAFEVKPYGLRAFFEANDLDYDDEVVIRREISPSGKSRAFINDTPVNLSVLNELSAVLIDLHQQFDSLDIHNVSFQLRMLDALADNKSLLESYQEIYRHYQSEKRQLSDLLQRNERSARELDFLNFQMEEFNQAELVDGEQESLEAELSRLTHAEDIKRTLSAAFLQLSENEQSVVGQLEEIGYAVATIAKIDAATGKLHERYIGLVAELQDISDEFNRIAEATEYNPERIQEVQERLDLIYRLQKKHGLASVAELLALQSDIEKQLSAFSDLGETIHKLEESIRSRETELQGLAEQLRERRKAQAPAFEEKVQHMLAQLGMQNAQLSVSFKALENLNATGLDEVNFFFAANKGSRLQTIKDVASGGELSRLTLVTKSLVASAIPLPTLIFDEIDTGISGDVALRMGNILRQLSNHHQVVSITHSPQVASKADAHYFVYKKENEDRTVTHVRSLTPDERVRAIATMLSQNPPSASAIENARELLSMNN